MISITRLNGEKFYLNADLIESVEHRGDTVIILTSGKRILIKESAEEAVKKVLIWKRNLLNNVTVRTMIIEEAENIAESARIALEK